MPAGGTVASGGTMAGTSGGAGASGRGGGASGGGAGGGTGGGSGASGTSTAGAAGEGGAPASGGSAGAGTGGGATAPPGCADPPWQPGDFATVIEVGPGLDVETPSDVAWELLAAGTLVRIHARPTPYADKWVLNAAGTASEPIVVLGVPENGVLPVISGDGARTRSVLDFWNEERGIVKIGGANVPDAGAAHVVVACLDIQAARPGISFSDSGGSSAEYADNAACVYLEEGDDIRVVNNEIHGCGNGIFASSGTSNVLISGNHVYDNGNAGSIYEHNSYTESTAITFEYNHYGPLCDGCDGNNLKDRSAGTVIRYNFIESGNRQLDLVESDYDELIGDPRYRETFVYGNLLLEPDGAGNSQIAHYGGDGGDESKYRKGTLYFYFNTVVSTRNGNTTLFRLSSEDESVDARDNVFYATAGGDRLAVSAGMGSVSLADNFLPSGWVDTHDTLTGSVGDGGNLEGSDPGFADAAAQDFSLAPGSPCIGVAGALPSAASGHPVSFEYVEPASGRPRPDDGDPDIGAFEAE